MDSVAPGLLAEYEQQGVTIIRYPVDKNETDLELALAQARSQGTSEIMVFGIIGDRWDMTIANALALAHPSLQDISIRAINGDEELIVIRSGRVVAIHGAPGEMVSLIPLCVPAAGITLDGLRYQLNNANLSFGAGRGLSNELLTHEGKIEIKQGILLCIITHHSQPIT